jgi:hypothetical protein
VATNNQNARIKSSYISKPVWEYSFSTVYASTGGSISIFLIFPHLFMFLRFIYVITYEKEQKITANMRNMGMNMALHYLSWVGYYMTLNTIFSIIWALIIKGGFMKTTDYFMIFFIYWLTGFFMISLAIFLHSFFTFAKPAVLSAIIAFFILYGVNVGL